MSFLTAINKAQRLCSLPVTASVIADGQETQNLLFALADTEVKALMRRHDWPQMRRTHTFTASLASLQSAPGKPTNFQRIVKGTFWNRTTDEEVSGPITDQEWALAYGEPFTSAITQFWMLRNDGLHIFPVPTAADTMAFEYVMNTPVTDSTGATYKTSFTADTDLCLFDEELLTWGVTWRYMQAKGRDYAEAMKTYEIMLGELVEASRGSRDVCLATQDEYELGRPLIPDTGYGA